jgi:hypothetical protein
MLLNNIMDAVRGVGGTILILMPWQIDSQLALDHPAIYGIRDQAGIIACFLWVDSE